MNKITRILITAIIGLASNAFAESSDEQTKGVFAQTNHTPKVLLDIRTRYEFGEQENRRPGHAATLRGRVGLESQDYYGFSGLVEFEATRAMNTRTYNAAGVHGDAARTVIADPESTELNRMQLQFKWNGNQLIGGRQRIIVNNARYVGNIGWRQNEQTFDAVTYKNTMVKDLSLYYGYIDNVKRIFGYNAPAVGGNAKEWNSDSHIVNVGYSGLKGHKFSCYGYFLEFDGDAVANANSSDTFGLSYSYKGKIASDLSLQALAEAAYQQDNGNNPANYDAPYFHLMGTLARKGFSGTVGYEVLGSDNGGFAFRTPVATAHKFNGWNDQFLVTPGIGLRDFYAGIGIPVPKVPMKLIYHYFTSDNGGLVYGHEIDALAVHKISKKMKAIAKASYYISENETPGVFATNFDRFRVSVELNYKY